MNHLAVVLLFATSLASGCAPARAAAPSIVEPPRAPTAAAEPLVAPARPGADDDDIREAVFRHLFHHNASGQQDAARAFCLQVEGRADPSPELLRRFEGNEPRAKKASL